MARPVQNTAFTTTIALESYSEPGNLKANPTIAAGDFQVSTDGGSFANLATLPTLEPSSSVAVKIVFSASEMNGERIVLRCVDQTSPKEWADLLVTIHTD